jgi:hypothetical protein
MRATDLMIGDWVKCGRSYMKVTQLAEDMDCDDIDPIIITPEILEKNGWRSMKNGSGDFILTKPMAGNSATITKTINGYEISHGAFNGLSIHYVHQLQHALRLCGIEKEIKLED